jgi:hypothetical protein
MKAQIHLPQWWVWITGCLLMLLELDSCHMHWPNTRVLWRSVQVLSSRLLHHQVSWSAALKKLQTSASVYWIVNLSATQFPRDIWLVLVLQLTAGCTIQHQVTRGKVDALLGILGVDCTVLGAELAHQLDPRWLPCTIQHQTIKWCWIVHGTCSSWSSNSWHLRWIVLH